MFRSVLLPLVDAGPRRDERLLVHHRVERVHLRDDAARRRHRELHRRDRPASSSSASTRTTGATIMAASTHHHDPRHDLLRHRAAPPLERPRGGSGARDDRRRRPDAPCARGRGALAGIPRPELPDWLRRELDDGPRRRGAVRAQPRRRGASGCPSRAELRGHPPVRCSSASTRRAATSPGSRRPTGSTLPGAAQLGYRRRRRRRPRRSGSELADRSLAVGANVVLGPVADVNTDPRNPVIGVRSFGDDARARRRATPWPRCGASSRRVPRRASSTSRATATPTSTRTTRLPALTIELDELERVHLPPFQAAIDAGVATVMTAHIVVPAWGDMPATLNPRGPRPPAADGLRRRHRHRCARHGRGARDRRRGCRAPCRRCSPAPTCCASRTRRTSARPPRPIRTCATSARCSRRSSTRSTTARCPSRCSSVRPPVCARSPSRSAARPSTSGCPSTRRSSRAPRSPSTARCPRSRAPRTVLDVRGRSTLAVDSDRDYVECDARRQGGTVLRGRRRGARIGRARRARRPVGAPGPAARPGRRTRPHTTRCGRRQRRACRAPGAAARRRCTRGPRAGSPPRPRATLLGCGSARVIVLSLQSGTSADGIDVAVVEIAADATDHRRRVRPRPAPCVHAATVDWERRAPRAHPRRVAAGESLDAGEPHQLTTRLGQAFAEAAARRHPRLGRRRPTSSSRTARPCSTGSSTGTPVAPCSSENPRGSPSARACPCSPTCASPTSPRAARARRSWRSSTARGSATRHDASGRTDRDREPRRHRERAARRRRRRRASPSTAAPATASSTPSSHRATPTASTASTATARSPRRGGCTTRCSTSCCGIRTSPRRRRSRPGARRSTSASSTVRSRHPAPTRLGRGPRRDPHRAHRPHGRRGGRRDAPHGRAPAVLVCSGGGALNPALLARLAALAAERGIAVESSAARGIDPAFKESLMFALLGFCSWHGVPIALHAGAGSHAARARPIHAGPRTTRTSRAARGLASVTIVIRSPRPGEHHDLARTERDRRARALRDLLERPRRPRASTRRTRAST